MVLSFHALQYTPIEATVATVRAWEKETRIEYRRRKREKGRERKGIVVAPKIRTSGIHQRQEPDVHIHSPTLIWLFCLFLVNEIKIALLLWGPPVSATTNEKRGKQGKRVGVKREKERRVDAGPVVAYCDSTFLIKVWNWTSACKRVPWLRAKRSTAHKIVKCSFLLGRALSSCLFDILAIIKWTRHYIRDALHLQMKFEKFNHFTTRSKVSHSSGCSKNFTYHSFGGFDSY